MEDIKVGESIRTKRGSIHHIARILEYKDNWYSIKDYGNNKIVYKLQPKNIVKHSKNIIDLIEKGDYVNGEEIVAIDYTEDDNGNYINVLGILEIEDDYAYPIELPRLNIKSVVTKEQFNSVKYEVER